MSNSYSSMEAQHGSTVSSYSHAIIPAATSSSANYSSSRYNTRARERSVRPVDDRRRKHQSSRRRSNSHHTNGVHAPQVLPNGQKQDGEEKAESYDIPNTYSAHDPTYHCFPEEINPSIYPREIIIEEESPAVDQEFQGHNSHYSEQEIQEMSSYGVNALQNNLEMAHASPTTYIWTSQQSSDERIRLGLPRYESEEQARAAYEQVHRAEFYQAP